MVKGGKLTFWWPDIQALIQALIYWEENSFFSPNRADTELRAG